MERDESHTNFETKCVGKPNKDIMISCLASKELNLSVRRTVAEEAIENGFLVKDIDLPLLDHAEYQKHANNATIIGHFLKTSDDKNRVVDSIHRMKEIHPPGSVREIIEACPILPYGPLTIVAPNLTGNSKKIIMVFELQGRKFIKIQSWRTDWDIRHLTFLVFSNQPISDWNPELTRTAQLTASLHMQWESGHFGPARLA